MAERDTVFSAIAGDTLRSLNVPPDMPVKQLVVSDDTASAAPAAPVKAASAAPQAKAKAAAAAAKQLATDGTANRMIVSDNAKNRPGVVR